MRDRAFGALDAGLTRKELVVEVARAVEDALPPHALEGAPVVLAVSGGPDSSALAHLVVEAWPQLHAVVGHVRHGLRDDAADAAVAAAHAAALGLEYHEARVQVLPEGDGVEAAARRARYRALAGIVQRLGACAVLVGHTADDQAETVLLNLARGTGLRGLGGMQPVRARRSETGSTEVEPGFPKAPSPHLDRADMDVPVVRPLLRVRRDDLRAFVGTEGLHTVEDPTNADPRQRRARARSVVLPALADLTGGGTDAVLALTRLADLARDDEQALDALAVEAARRSMGSWGPCRVLRREDVEAVPPAVARRMLRLMLAEVRPAAAGVSADTLARVLALPPGRALHVAGGVHATSGGGWIAVIPAEVSPLAARPVAVPCTTELPEVGLLLHADVIRGGPGRTRGGERATDAAHSALLPPERTLAAPPPGGTQPTWAVLAAGCTPLQVRSRRPGDRLRVPAGSRKLQDVLVDAGTPRALRDLVPVVVDAGDTPLWVPGLTLPHPRAAAGAHRPAGEQIRLWLAPAVGSR